MRSWFPGLVPGCIPTHRPPRKIPSGSRLGAVAGRAAGNSGVDHAAMEDRPSVDEPQHDGLGRVHVVAATWRAVEGAEGRRLAGRLAEVLMDEHHDLAAADWPRPGG